MLTVFSTPKPFVGHSDIIRRNALKSWTLLRPGPHSWQVSLREDGKVLDMWHCAPNMIIVYRRN
jgi:hypothetical protein